MRFIVIKYVSAACMIHGLCLLSLYTFYVTHNDKITHVLKHVVFNDAGRFPSNLTTYVNISRPAPQTHATLNFKERIALIITKHIQKRRVSKLRKRILEAGFIPEKTMIFYEKPKDVNNNTIIALPKRVPKSSTRKVMKTYDTCALLGNSGILTGSACGREIDAHDFIIRSNLAPTIGFENDVGTKTNLTTVNGECANIIFKCLTKPKVKCGKKSLNKLKEFDDAILWFSKFGVVPSKNYAAVTKAVLDLGLKTEVAYPRFGLPKRIGRFWNITRASSGLVMLTVAAAFCNKISMYGFYPFYEKPDGTKLSYHYDESHKMLNYTTDKHGMPIEYKMFLKLNSTGNIRLVTECYKCD